MIHRLIIRDWKVAYHNNQSFSLCLTHIFISISGMCCVSSSSKLANLRNRSVLISKKRKISLPIKEKSPFLRQEQSDFSHRRMLTFPEFSQGDIAPNSTRSEGLVKTWHFWCDTRADEKSANVSSLIARIGRVERSAEVARLPATGRDLENLSSTQAFHLRQQTVRSDARQPLLVRLRSTWWTDRSIKVDPIHCRTVTVQIMKPFDAELLQMFDTNYLISFKNCLIISTLEYI